MLKSRIEKLELITPKLKTKLEARAEEVYRHFWSKMTVPELKLSLYLLEKKEFPVYETDDPYQPLDTLLNLVLSRLQDYYYINKEKLEELSRSKGLDNLKKIAYRKENNIHEGLINI